ncbi:DUF2029 domain-containing protein [bacterium]|nr:DUF2029 domain-containing protein [bacterium]NBX81901.1 DUF2029 domain-containing protein [bacterium]
MKRVNHSLQQTAVLAFWSFLCVLPVLLKTGPNVVTRTYWEGTERFFQGVSPYGAPSAGADAFFYPPFFAVFWKLFALTGELPSVLLWSFANSFLFWWGVSQWVNLQWKQSRWTWFFLISSAIELDISLRYQQANALMAGLILWAVSEFRYQRFGRAGFLLALGTHFKVFPLVLVGFLAFPAQWAFIGSYAASGLLLLFVPAVVYGFSDTLWLHWEQFHSTTTDFSQRDLLDLAACFKRWGLAHLGEVMRWGTLIVGSTVLLAYRFFIPNAAFAFGFWYSSIMAWLLAVTPKAESPTFVWIAPAYLLLGTQLKSLTRWVLVGLSLALTWVYSSVFPKAAVTWLTHDYNSKTLANWGLWIFTCLLLVREMSVQRRKKLVN